MIPLLLYLALQTGDPFAEGVRAYRADDFEAAFTAFAAVAMITGRRVSRREGALLEGGYLAFLLVLIEQAS